MEDEPVHTVEPHVQAEAEEPVKHEHEPIDPESLEHEEPVKVEREESTEGVEPVVVASESSNPAFEFVKNILYWKNLLRSALVFGVVNFIFILLVKGNYSLLTLTTDLMLILLGLCFAYVWGSMAYKHFIHKQAAENPFAGHECKFNLSKEMVVEYVEMLLPHLNHAITGVCDLFFVKNSIQSLKFAGLLFVMSELGSWFTLAGLMWIGTLILFIWPRLYEEKHELIDFYVGLARRWVEDKFAIVLARLPMRIGPVDLKKKEE